MAEEREAAIAVRNNDSSRNILRFLMNGTDVVSEARQPLVPLVILHFTKGREFGSLLGDMGNCINRQAMICSMFPASAMRRT